MVARPRGGSPTSDVVADRMSRALPKGPQHHVDPNARRKQLPEAKMRAGWKIQDSDQEEEDKAEGVSPTTYLRQADRRKEFESLSSDDVESSAITALRGSRYEGNRHHYDDGGNKCGSKIAKHTVCSDDYDGDDWGGLMQPPANIDTDTVCLPEDVYGGAKVNEYWHGIHGLTSLASAYIYDDIWAGLGHYEVADRAGVDIPGQSILPSTVGQGMDEPRWTSSSYTTTSDTDDSVEQGAQEPEKECFYAGGVLEPGSGLPSGMRTHVSEKQPSPPTAHDDADMILPGMVQRASMMRDGLREGGSFNGALPSAEEENFVCDILLEPSTTPPASFKGIAISPMVAPPKPQQAD